MNITKTDNTVTIELDTTRDYDVKFLHDVASMTTRQANSLLMADNKPELRQIRYRQSKLLEVYLEVAE